MVRLLDSSVFDDLIIIIVERGLRVVVDISMIGEEDNRRLGAHCQIYDRNDSAMFKSAVVGATPLQAVAFALTEAIRMEYIELAK